MKTKSNDQKFMFYGRGLGQHWTTVVQGQGYKKKNGFDFFSQNSDFKPSMGSKEQTSWREGEVNHHASGATS